MNYAGKRVAEQLLLVQTQYVKRVAQIIVLDQIERIETKRFGEFGWMRRRKYQLRHFLILSASVST